MIKIVLPFKDDLPVRRFKSCLDKFIPEFQSYLNKNMPNNYELFVVEEHSPDTSTFNLGRTINIGFDLVKNTMNDDDIFMFHPIDILPINTNYSVNKNTKFCMLGYRPTPAKFFHSQKILDGHYYYKAICLTKKDFEKANGFTNDFVGWGGEDDEFFLRLELNNIDLDIAVNEYIALTHNGSNGPNHGLHLSVVDKSIAERKCFSGIDTLKYELLYISQEANIKRYVVI